MRRWSESTAVWVTSGIVGYFAFGLTVGSFTDAAWVGLVSVVFGVAFGYAARNLWLWRRNY